MQTSIERVKQAIKDLQAGKMVILTDDPHRENEGDLIIAAEKITTASMNFLIRHGTGIVCMPMLKSHCDKLNLDLMVKREENSCLRHTQFTVSIDAANGITTGVSAADRTHTVSVVMRDEVKPSDIVKPGHLFPLIAEENGVLTRQGHTEGSIDLMRFAGFKPMAVLCEIMNPDGTMTRGQELIAFSQKHELILLEMDDLIAYRHAQDHLSIEKTQTTLSLAKYGEFQLTAIRDKITGGEHLALYKAPLDPTQPPLVRIHSSCTTGDLFASTRCDCHDQLHFALQAISEKGGLLIYLNQEGRGIGLFNKINAYHLQDQGYDTVEANAKLGLPIDARQYDIAASILKQFNLHHIKLLTHNPAKIKTLEKHGIQVTRAIMPTFHHQNNLAYLKTKKDKLNHLISFD